MISAPYEQPALPAWARALASAAQHAIHFRGDGHTTSRFAHVTATSDVLEIAPSLGESDDDIGPEPDVVDTVDLMALRAQFSGVSEAKFRINEAGAPFISVAGDSQGHAVELRIYLVPLEESL